MSHSFSGKAVALATFAGLVATGCGDAGQSARAEDVSEDVGEIVLELVSVPSDVRCIEVTVEGPVRSVTRRFNVTPGSSAALAVNALPLGTVAIDEQTFAVACGQVTGKTESTWVSVPQTATLVPGQTTAVTVVLRRPGKVSITSDFQESPNEPSLGSFDGFLYQAPCQDNIQTYDCQQVACVNGAKSVQQQFTLSGTPGAPYNVAIRVRGVVEPKRYNGGTRRAGNFMDPSSEGGDFWYEGGAPVLSVYNTFKLEVSPPVPGAASSYFLNSATLENHTTWALNYTATIPMLGGGSMTFSTTDTNCRQSKNCGPGIDPQTCSPRILTIDAAPSPPASFAQPNLGGPAPGQWVHIDVLSITPQ